MRIFKTDTMRQHRTPLCTIHLPLIMACRAVSTALYELPLSPKAYGEEDEEQAVQTFATGSHMSYFQEASDACHEV